MKSLYIEQLDEGFLIRESSGKRWAINSHDTLIIRIKAYFGITKKWSSEKVIVPPAAVSEIQAERLSSPTSDGRQSNNYMSVRLTNLLGVDAATQPISSQSPSTEQHRSDLQDTVESIANSQHLEKNKLGTPDTSKQEVNDEGQTAERQDESMIVQSMKQDGGVLSPSDLKIPYFDYSGQTMQQYKTVFFWELPDDRVVLEYSNNHYYTTKEKVMRIPYPHPRKYFSKENGWSSTVGMAFKSYRRYLAEQEQKPQPEPSRIEKLRDIAKVNEKRWQIQEDRKDDDWKYKKILKTDTRGSHGEDFEKVEGSLNE